MKIKVDSYLYDQYKQALEDHSKHKFKKERIIRNIETGLTFTNPYAAAYFKTLIDDESSLKSHKTPDHNLGTDNIINVCEGKRNTCGCYLGIELHWEYL